MTRVILTCNAGSTNTKLAAYDAASGARLAHATTRSEAETTAWLSAYDVEAVAAVGHRVVHGGRKFIAPTLVSEGVMQELRTLVPLAPLHQPAALALIEVLQKRFTRAPQIACFDTAFHHTMREEERYFPLPRDYGEAGVQRYGFHGLSYEYIVTQLPKHVADAEHKRIVVAHLGGGASACAIKGLKSAASTMGFSTLDGLMMGTRCGAIDAGVVLHLLEEKRMTPQAVATLLYKESGLKGVSGISGEMRELLASDSAHAKEAVELYCYLAAKQIASLLPAIGGMDVLVFTGGIGENASPVRERILAHLGWVENLVSHVIATNEEAVLFSACLRNLQA